MVNHYVEFDTNSQALIADLAREILNSGDWARIDQSPALMAQSAATAAGVSSITYASTAGLQVGDSVAIDVGALREYRTISSMTATQLTFAGGGLAFAHAAGTELSRGNAIFKATTTRGAQMVVDLNDGGLPTTYGYMSLGVYQSHDGTIGLGKVPRYLNWRYNNSGHHTHPLHVTLSLGREHFFLAIEGPRPGETGAVSSTYGSWKSYFFISEIVPYEPTIDTTPAVFMGANLTPQTSGSTVSQGAHIGHASRNIDNTAYWAPGRLATLQMPVAGEVEILNVQRQRQLDGKYILSPYVLFSDAAGMRGRLSSLFFAGYNHPTEFEAPPPPLGSKVEYQGNWYKLITVGEGDGNRANWGQLGMVANGSSTNAGRSPVVAVPCLP